MNRYIHHKAVEVFLVVTFKRINCLVFVQPDGRVTRNKIGTMAIPDILGTSLVVKGWTVCDT